MNQLSEKRKINDLENVINTQKICITNTFDWISYIGMTFECLFKGFICKIISLP